LPWQIAIASGWESEGPGFELGSSRQPLTLGCQKNQQKHSEPYSVPLLIDFARRTLKGINNLYFCIFVFFPILIFSSK